MFELALLPYDVDALAPFMSAETLTFHHGKHHKGYVATLNTLIRNTPFAGLPIEDIIRQTAINARDRSIFNNAAQSWNHDFFWKSLSPSGGGPARGAVRALIVKKFGSDAAFSKAFIDTAVAHFGSGWIWLISDGDDVDLMTTHDADLPLAHGQVALLTCDLWEHAYYLDYQNQRPAFVEAYLEHLVNWDFANGNLQKAFERALPVT